MLKSKNRDRYQDSPIKILLS